MTEILISLGIFVIVMIGLFYLATLIPKEPLKSAAMVILVIGGLIWLLTHIRPIVHAIAGS